MLQRMGYVAHIYFFLQRKWMFPTQRMLSREDDPAAPLFPSDFFANINSNKDEQVRALWFMLEGIILPCEYKTVNR